MSEQSFLSNSFMYYTMRSFTTDRFYLIALNQYVVQYPAPKLDKNGVEFLSVISYFGGTRIFSKIQVPIMFLNFVYRKREGARKSAPAREFQTIRT